MREPAVLVVDDIKGGKNFLRCRHHAGLFAQLPHSGPFDGFRALDAPARKTPTASIWRIGAAHEENPPTSSNHSKGSSYRLTRCRHRWCLLLRCMFFSPSQLLAPC